MIRKKLLLTFILSIFILVAQAGHEVGGVILSYKSLAANGNPLEYEIKAYALFSLQGASPPGSITVQISSSCFPNFSKTLAIQSSGGNLKPLQGVDYCISANPPPPNMGVATFKGTVILPGVCNDYKIVSASGFGKMNNTNNLSNTFSNDYFYLMLNNVPGPHSSPQIDPSEMYMAACLNKPLNLYSFSEPDGDSLYFSKSVPQSQSGSTGVDRIYNFGYSSANQVGSSSGFNINHQTGLIQTQLNAAGSYIITIKYQEYALDPALSAKVLVGESRYSYFISGFSFCYTPPFTLQMPVTPNSDSLVCGTTAIIGAASRKMAISTISTDGSDFVAISQRQGSLTISSAQALNNENFQINLAQAVVPNDTIIVYAKTGNDNDVVYSHCGQELTAMADTLTFYTPVPQSLNSAFSYTINGLSVNFTAGGSSQLADSLLWDFGDGNQLSNQLNPVHNYLKDSIYDVSLILFGACGATDTIIQSLYLCGTISGAFTYQISGDTVFVDATGSVGANGYIWNFGDGNTGGGVNTSNWYAVKGNYQITLQVFNLCGDTIAVTDSIELCQSPQAWWTYNIISSSSNGMTINFDGTASINARDFEWDFGDGNTNNTSATPTHNYATPSLTYLVSLTVVNECEEKHTYAYRLNQIGLEEEINQTKYELYPNPASEYIFLKGGTPDNTLRKIQIYDQQGRVIYYHVLSERFNKEIRIDLPELPAGLYWIKIVSDKGENQQMLSIYDNN